MIVEIIYINGAEEFIRTIEISAGATLKQAICDSGLLEHYPEISLEQTKFGIFGKVVPLNSVLQDGDRVEIYQSLLIDPMEARRLRAEQKMDDS